MVISHGSVRGDVRSRGRNRCARSAVGVIPGMKPGRDSAVTIRRGGY